MLYRYSSRCDKFSARVDDRTNVEAFPVIGTLSHNLQRSAGTICPSASEELYARVHTTLVEYNYLDRVMFPFQQLRQLPFFTHLVVLQVCNITDADYLSPDALVGSSSTLAGQKTTSPLSAVLPFRLVSCLRHAIRVPTRDLGRPSLTNLSLKLELL
jgi:hypothetical protein